MRYTLLMHYPEMTDADLDPEAMADGMARMAAYSEALEQAQVLLAAEVFTPTSAATTVRLVDGSVQIEDGPFADTKEQLGGTFVIDVPDLDAALEWAKQAPPLQWGAVEIRPGAVHTVAGVWTPNV